MVEEKKESAPSDIVPGEIFLKKNEAVCVKTIDGAVWIQQMRKPKNKENPHSFKLPSTIHLGELAKDLPEIEEDPLSAPDNKTFQ